MKKSIPVLIAAAVLLVWLGPLLAGVLDTFCWFAVSAQCTPIAWDGDHKGFVFAWTFCIPVAGLLGAMLLSGLAGG